MEKKKKMRIDIIIIAIIILGIVAVTSIYYYNLEESKSMPIQASEEQIKSMSSVIIVTQMSLESTLDLCSAVESRSDYQQIDSKTFDLILIMGETLTQLELEGYGVHPKLGPMITETRELLRSVDFCFNELALLYE